MEKRKRKPIINVKILTAFIEKEKQKIMKERELLLHTGKINKYQDNSHKLTGLSIVSDYLENGNY